MPPPTTFHPSTLARANEAHRLSDVLLVSGFSSCGYYKVVMTPSDLDLLRDFSDHQSEEAFAALVHRHIDLVHSAATRLTGNRHFAEEVAQSVFLALAQEVSGVTQKVNLGMPLSSWLHITTRNLAAKIVRTEIRRQAREQAPDAMHLNPGAQDSSTKDWEHIAAHLDQGLYKLSESDRRVVLLRFFEGKTAREIGLQLGIAEDAAQKRVLRALDRLRSHLHRLAPGLSSSTLASLLGAWAVQKAPTVLAGTIAQAAFHGLGTATSVGIVHGIPQVLAQAFMTKSQMIATGFVVATLALPIAYQAREIHDLRDPIPPTTPAITKSAAPPPGVVVPSAEASLATVSSANGEANEIARLRARADELRKAIADRRNTPQPPAPRLPQAAGPLLLRPGQPVAVTNLVVAGTDSPEATAQTVLAHMRDGNLDATLSLLLLSPDERAEMESEILQDVSVREDLVQRMKREMDPLLTLELLGVESLTDRRSAVSLRRVTANETNLLRMVLGRTSTGWRQIQ